MLDPTPKRAAGLVSVALVRSDVSRLAGGFKGSMSGVCGVCVTNPEGLAYRLTAMTKAMALKPADGLCQKIDSAAGAAVGLAASFPTHDICEQDHILLACEAELYNEAELRQSLGEGPDRATAGRTAVLLASLYRRFGDNFAEKLRGSFSIILWDRTRRRLLATIDGFGIGRLVYAENGMDLAVASRIDALVSFGINMDVNPRAIVNCTELQREPGPGNDIQRHSPYASPGTILIAEAGTTRFVKYWDMRYGVADGRDEESSGSRSKTGLRCGW